MDWTPLLDSTSHTMTMKTNALSDCHSGDSGRIRAQPPQVNPPRIDGDTLVVVRAEWKEWRTAMVRMTDLEDIRWSQPSGAARPLIHAHVCCNKIVSGEVPHSCHLTVPPHRLTVCVLKHDSASGLFDELSRRADRRGTSADGHDGLRHQFFCEEFTESKPEPW
jgi:hypothetical protein